MRPLPTFLACATLYVCFACLCLFAPGCAPPAPPTPAKTQATVSAPPVTTATATPPPTTTATATTPPVTTTTGVVSGPPAAAVSNLSAPVVICPVKRIAADPAVAPVAYQGKTYSFCCTDCRKDFLAAPQKFIR